MLPRTFTQLESHALLRKVQGLKATVLMRDPRVLLPGIFSCPFIVFCLFRGLNYNFVGETTMWQ